MPDECPNGLNTNIVNLINNETGNILYPSVAEVNQDEEFLMLKDYPDGIFSIGFSACYAVIIRNTIEPLQTALAHVSSVDLQGIGFFEDMIAAVSTDTPFSIELARSMQGYTDQYEEDKQHKLDEDENELDPTAYFLEQDREYRAFFNDHFNIEPIIHDMPSSVIVINHLGELDFLAEHPYSELATQEINTTESSSSLTNSSLFFTDSNLSGSKRKNIGDEPEPEKKLNPGR